MKRLQAVIGLPRLRPIARAKVALLICRPVVQQLSSSRRWESVSTGMPVIANGNSYYRSERIVHARVERRMRIGGRTACGRDRVNQSG